MTVYVAHVKSTVKRGCSVALGPKTLLVGANGAGKSTIVQSIELATRGYVTDMEGRDQVQAGHVLARLFSQPQMMSSCTLSDGRQFLWQTEAKPTGGFKDPTHVQSCTVRFPVQEMTDLLSSESLKLGMWLERQVLGPLAPDDFLRPLPPEIRESVLPLVQTAPRLDFLSIAKAAKDEARRLRAEATKAEKVLQGSTIGVSIPLLETDRTALEARLEVLRAQPTAARATRAMLLREIERQTEELVDCMDKLAAMPEPEKSSANVQLYLQLHEVQQSYARLPSRAACWVCGTPGVEKNIEQINEAVQGLLADVRQQLKARSDYDLLTARMAKLQVDLGQQVALFKATPDVPDTSAERDEVVRKLAADTAVRRLWANAAAERTKILHLRVRADHLTTASNVLTDFGKELVENKKCSFEQKVQQFLPGRDVFGIDLDTGRVGLQRPAAPGALTLHTALSGAEESRVLLALAATQVRPDEVCVFTPRDRAWDPVTLVDVMDAMSQAPGQVILMSTVMPASVPSGWSVVHV